MSRFSDLAHDFYLNSEVEITNEVPTALQFYRKWVSNNKPVLLKGACVDWPAYKLWDFEYLKSKLGDSEVTVAWTPNGLADAVYDNKFVKPDEQKFSFSTFLSIMSGDLPSYQGVYYIQKQNSNFTDDVFYPLWPDCPASIPWVSEALDRLPEAVNFWFGDHKSITSFHKDFYENMYCVVSGRKLFTLVPSVEADLVPYETYQSATYRQISHESGGCEVMLDEDKVPWISWDPLQPLEVSPVKNVMQVSVEAGDILYLPALWYHHVQQDDDTIAINYWYDMDFDWKYCLHDYLTLNKSK